MKMNKEMTKLVQKYNADVTSDLRYNERKWKAPREEDVFKGGYVEEDYVDDFKYCDRIDYGFENEFVDDYEKVREVNAKEFNKKDISPVFAWDEEKGCGKQLISSPKDMGYKKNVESKSRVIDYLVFEKDDEFTYELPENNNEVEAGYSFARENLEVAYKYLNEDAKVVINGRYRRYLKLTKEERRVRDE